MGLDLVAVVVVTIKYIVDSDFDELDMIKDYQKYMFYDCSVCSKWPGKKHWRVTITMLI